MVAFVPSGADREAIVARTRQRFAWSHPAIGSASELVDHYGRLADQGIERVYTWFYDFAPSDTLAAFGAEVIHHMAPSASPGGLARPHSATRETS